MNAIAPLIIEPSTDEDDRAWLEKRVNTFAAGFRAAHQASVEIAKNWSNGRAVGRLFPDYPDAAAFLIAYVGPVRLPPEDRDRFIVALVESGSSRRKAAKAAGVSHATAERAVKGGTNVPHREPSQAKALAKHVDDVLGSRATLPDEIDKWLITNPPESERAALRDAFTRLLDRVTHLMESIE